MRVTDKRSNSLVKVGLVSRFVLFTAKEVEASFNVKAIGESMDVMESSFAITIDRKVKTPSAETILNTAREQFFTI